MELSDIRSLRTFAAHVFRGRGSAYLHYKDVGPIARGPLRLTNSVKTSQSDTGALTVRAGLWGKITIANL